MWFSDRARHVVSICTFSFAPVKAADDAEQLGRELIESVPEGITVIHQELQGDQLQTWVIRKGKVQFVATAAGATLAGGIVRFRRPKVAIDARSLHEVLLRPVQQHVGNADQSVHSPGRALRRGPVCSSSMMALSAFVIEEQIRLLSRHRLAQS